MPGTDDLVEAATVYLDASVRRAHPEAAATAIGWLEQAIRADPKCPKAHFQLGVLHEEQKHPELAVEHYRLAIQADPQCLMALTNLAILYRTLGDEAGARAMAEQALAIETDPIRRRALQRLLESTVAGPVGQ
jgi:lipopolysaccharide biosynthesis regulator YciM